MALGRGHNPTVLAAIAVGVAAIGFGSVPYFAKTLTDSGMAAPAVAFHRYLLVAVVLSPFLRLGRAARSESAWSALAGAAMALGWSGYVKSLDVFPVSTAGVIYMSYPAFTVLIAWLWLREGLTIRAVACSALILLAAVLVLTPEHPSAGEPSSSGLLFAVTAPVTFAFAINILARKVGGLPPLSRVAGLACGAAIGLSPLLLSLPAAEALPGSASDLWTIAGICIVTALIPQLLYVIHAPVIGATKAAMLGGLELPTMVLIGWLAFSQPLLLEQLAAASLVLAAIILTPDTPARA